MGYLFPETAAPTPQRLEQPSSQRPDIFVPREARAAYLEEHGIRLEKLPNGITLLGVARNTSDSIHTIVRTTYTNGSWTERIDSDGKTEITHFLEHLFGNPTIDSLASDTASSFNATTSLRTVGTVVSGIAIPGNETVGIWGLLPAVRDCMKDPLDRPDIEQAVEAERKRVIAELTGYKDAEELHDSRVSHELDPILWENTDPLFKSISEEERIRSTQSITLEDLKSHANNIMNPKNLVISVYTEGSTEILDQLIGRLSELYTDFPSNTNPPLSYPENREEKINPNLQPGTRFERDTQKGDQATITLA